jgi:hypothetical protein
MLEALCIEEAALPSEAKPPLRDLVPVLVRGVEVGLFDSANIQRLLDELDTAPDMLLPDLMPQLQIIAYHAWKAGRTGLSMRIVMTCLAWFLRNSSDTGTITVLTQTVQQMQGGDEGQFPVETIHAVALRGFEAHEESWRLDKDAVGSGVRVFEIGDKHNERYRYRHGFTPLIRSRPPTTRFHGWLKQMNPAVLNASGRQLLRDAFPFFTQLTLEEQIARTERLAALGIALNADDKAELATLRELAAQSVPVDISRHRRFAGGDGMLPRSCYYTLCRDKRGDDCYCLSRELFAYVDYRVPGFVYVGDSTSTRLVAALRTTIRAKHGYCVIWVLMLPPTDPKALSIYRSYYRDLFALLGNDADTQAFALEAQVVKTVIDNVLDLRLPEIQRWFFHHFKDGDGHFLIKDGGTATEFFDLVPTLMDPALGGTGETHAIGSWLRSSGVDALIYPSARSDVSVVIRDGELQQWQGWNLIDYRTARKLPATETIRNSRGWPDFHQPGVRLSVAGGQLAGSWRTDGVQVRHDELRTQIEGFTR